MLELSKLNRGTIVWSALLAAGVAGTVVDPNGPIGITSFGVATAAAVYLIALPFRKAVRRVAAAPRPKSVLTAGDEGRAVAPPKLRARDENGSSPQLRRPLLPLDR
jgi:hypothetical protein